MTSRAAMLMLKVILVLFLFLFTPNPWKKKCLFQGPYNFSSRGGGRFQTSPVEGKWSPPIPTPHAAALASRESCSSFATYLVISSFTDFTPQFIVFFFTANVLLVHKSLQHFCNFKAPWQPKVIFFCTYWTTKYVYIFAHEWTHCLCLYVYE